MKTGEVEILKHLLSIALANERFDEVSCKYCSHRDSNGYCPLSSIGDECLQTTEETITLLIEHYQEV